MQIIRHSEQTLKTALISKNPVLVSQYEKLDAGEQRLMNEAFQRASDLFGPITLHSPSDWITSHPEAPQDFEQFFSDPYRKTPSPNKRSIYIQSIGDILKFLKKKKPEDAFCVVGITMIDLYPRDSWNFVFGQASLTDGVGIFSFARYGSDFYSMRYEGKVKKLKKTSSSDYSIFDNYYIPEITSVLLLRSCKALVRWIDDESSDIPGATPEHSREDNGNLPKPVEAFKEWKEWIIKCLAVLQK
uniref:Archaelysin family metallopeptidase 2 n=1 Tax=Nomascus leucogenys TaxID=61853 RepID=A0A2I3HAI8_NOMLE